MDENKLSELMKNVVADAPPATFDQGDITRESARQRQRHRNGVLAGSAFGVAILAGATALGVALWTGPGATSDMAVAGEAASPSNGNAAPYELPNEDADSAAPTERGQRTDSSPETPKQGGSSVEEGGPAGPASTPGGCEQVDRELAAALAGELPATAGVEASDARRPTLSCAEGASGARFDLTDGRITAIVAPPGVMLLTYQLQPGSQTTTVDTPDGYTVMLVSEPFEPGESAPYADDLSRIAATLARDY